eukprot:223544-Pleurochrysis_carterae.AAC.1
MKSRQTKSETIRVAAFCSYLYPLRCCCATGTMTARVLYSIGQSDCLARGAGDLVEPRRCTLFYAGPAPRGRYSKSCGMLLCCSLHRPLSVSCIQVHTLKIIRAQKLLPTLMARLPISGSQLTQF